VASIQTSRSTPPDCHSDWAKAAASWVLPDDLSQSCASEAATEPGTGAAARSGTSATAAPAGSAVGRPGAVSSLALKPSASAGTVPDRIGQDGRPGAAPAGPSGGTALLMARCPRLAVRGQRGRGRRPVWLSRSSGCSVRASRLHHRCPSLPIISADRQSPPVTSVSGGGRPSAGLAHSSWLKTSTGLLLVSVSLRKKAGAVTRMKAKPITPATADSTAMMKIPPICQCRTGTVHVV
jgi:hypothetical protein